MKRGRREGEAGCGDGGGGVAGQRDARQEKRTSEESGAGGEIERRKK